MVLERVTVGATAASFANVNPTGEPPYSVPPGSVMEDAAVPRASNHVGCVSPDRPMPVVVSWSVIARSSGLAAVIWRTLGWRRSWATRHVLLAFDGPGKQFDEPSTGDHAHAIAERDALWQRLATLPRRQRSVLVLRYYERLADAEIAEVLGCSAVTVRGYASRALATLRLGEAAQRDLATTAVSTTAANLRELR